ncbi:hypothetical protein [Candidatus Methylomirabilis sp.]|jgi:hypothetical protein
MLENIIAALIEVLESKEILTKAEEASKVMRRLGYIWDAQLLP